MADETGDIRIIRIDNPPVNSLGLAVRRHLRDRLAEAVADPGVRALVLTGAGRHFSAGADIAEFGSAETVSELHLSDLIAAVEASPKPVVAAVQGVAMGDGLELALGCHARVAARDAKVALPEIKLGLIPGAGGTQRLPRAVDLATA